MNDRLTITSQLFAALLSNSGVTLKTDTRLSYPSVDSIYPHLEKVADALIAAAGEEKPTDYVDRNYMKVTCPHCNGHGVMEDKSSTSGWKLCPRCNGTKIVYTELIAEYEQPKPSVPSVEEMILMLEKKGLSLERKGRGIDYQHYIRSIKAIHQFLTERAAK